MAELGTVKTVTFHFPAGSTVNVGVTKPTNVVVTPVPVTETTPGDFPFTLTLDIEGTWRLVGSDGSHVETAFVNASIPQTPLATVEDFQTQTDTELNSEDAARVAALLQAISSDVRDYTGKPYPDSAVALWLRAAVVEAAVELGALGGSVDPRIAAYSVGETATTYRSGNNFGFLTPSLRSRLPRRVHSIQGLEDYGDVPTGDTWYPLWSPSNAWPFL
jgi:hypothetical protein